MDVEFEKLRRKVEHVVEGGKIVELPKEKETNGSIDHFARLMYAAERAVVAAKQQLPLET